MQCTNSLKAVQIHFTTNGNNKILYLTVALLPVLLPFPFQWQYLPAALLPDQPYDAGGCWSGSATILSDGSPTLLYTGASRDGIQSQCQAHPEDPKDPFLVKWKKDPRNPVVLAPDGVNASNFRDPTTGWVGGDGQWHVLVGARREGVDVALVYESSDFRNWTMQTEPMRTAPQRAGMWEVRAGSRVAFGWGFGWQRG